jgi:hypothetical protein
MIVNEDPASVVREFLERLPDSSLEDLMSNDLQDAIESCVPYLVLSEIVGEHADVRHLPRAQLDGNVAVLLSVSLAAANRKRVGPRFRHRRVFATNDDRGVAVRPPNTPADPAADDWGRARIDAECDHPRMRRGTAARTQGGVTISRLVRRLA